MRKKTLHPVGFLKLLKLPLEKPTDHPVFCTMTQRQVFCIFIQEFHLWQFCQQNAPNYPGFHQETTARQETNKIWRPPVSASRTTRRIRLLPARWGSRILPHRDVRPVEEGWKTHVKQSHQFLMFAFGVCSFFFCPENLQINVFDTDLVEFPLFFKFRSFIHHFHVRYANR